jgi:hypothetical protein
MIRQRSGGLPRHARNGGGGRGGEGGCNRADCILGCLLVSAVLVIGLFWWKMLERLEHQAETRAAPEIVSSMPLAEAMVSLSGSLSAARLSAAFNASALGRSPARQARVVVAGMFKDFFEGLEGSVAEQRTMLRRVFALMKETGGHFAEFRLVLFENDSQDQSAYEVRALCQAEPTCLRVSMRIARELHKFVDLGQRVESTSAGWAGQWSANTNEHPEDLKPFLPKRFRRMSFIRNQVLRVAKRLRGYDYLVFVDADMLKREWTPKLHELEAGVGGGPACPVQSPDGAPVKIGGNAQAWDPSTPLAMLHRSWQTGLVHFADKDGQIAPPPPLQQKQQQQQQLSVLCGHGVFSSSLLLYDALALRLASTTPMPANAQRCEPHLTRSQWNSFLSATAIVKGTNKPANLVLSMHRLAFERSLGQIPVDSCFGGLAIYRLAALRTSGCAYDELTTECEHVSLNACLNTHFPSSIYLDTAAPIFYDSEAYASWSKLGGDVAGAATEPLR